MNAIWIHIASSFVRFRSPSTPRNICIAISVQSISDRRRDVGQTGCQPPVAGVQTQHSAGIFDEKTQERDGLSKFGTGQRLTHTNIYIYRIVSIGSMVYNRTTDQ